MTTPITTRLDPATLEALDRAIEAGIGSTRAAIIAEAVREWLELHGEEAIAASYRRRYSTPDTKDADLLARFSSFSVAACLAAKKG
ncbi:MAG: ribbon-helix-helix domain-containing protein [Acidimicrobiales bacterium]